MIARIRTPSGTPRPMPIFVEELRPEDCALDDGGEGDG